MGWEAPWHWVVLAIIVIALFGYKKLPDAARSLGRSLRIFKTEIKGMGEDDAARDAAKDKQPPAIAPPPSATPPVAPPVETENGAAPAVTAQAEKPATSGQ
jgi:sec-independent protein translocase protein TatA